MSTRTSESRTPMPNKLNYRKEKVLSSDKFSYILPSFPLGNEALCDHITLFRPGKLLQIVKLIFPALRNKIE
jgi:hypothetical protein